ncbi:MAG: PAS domain-containing protein, partial [Actinomycetota bacterium]
TEAEARFRTIVERVPAVSYVWDEAPEPGTAQLGYISPQLERLLGYTPEEWAADPDAWNREVHPDDREPVLATWERAAAEGRPFVAEYRVRHADGRWRWIRDEANPVADAVVPARLYQGVIHDVTDRREAEDRVRESEERWRTLLEQLPVTTYMMDYDAGGEQTVRDRWVGPGALALTGYTVEEWLADDFLWEKSLHPADRARVEAAWTAAERNGGTHEAEYRMLRKDGATIWVHEEMAITLRDGRVRVDGVMTDVTERYEAESAIRQAEARFRTLVEQLPALIYIEDPRTGENLYISPQIVDILGFTPEEWGADPHLWEARLHPDDHDWVVAENAAEGDAWSVDYRSIARDGRVVWLHNEALLVRDEEDEPLDWQGVTSAITERKAAEERLREAEERYRSLVEQLPVALYTDAVDEVSSALYVSPRYEQLTGYSPAERLEDPGLWASMLHPDDRERVLAESARTNATGEPFDVEYRIVRADGLTAWLHDHAVLVEGPGGRQVWQGVLQDVTERRLAEDALSRRDAILQATGFAAERFLRSASWREGLEEILARLARAGGAERAAVWEKRVDEDGTVRTSLIGCWDAQGHELADDGATRDVPWDEAGFGRWTGILERGEVLQGLIADMPASERSYFEARDPGQRSVLAAPVFADDEWWGYIGFDHCGDARIWHQAELDAIVATAATLGAAIVRERAEARLSETQRRYRTLVEQIPAMTYVEDAVTRDAIYVSPQAEAILGYGPDEWGTYETWLSCVHPADLDRVVGIDAGTNATGEPYHAEYRLRHRGGHYVWIRDEAVLVRDGQGRPVYWQGVRFDISAEKASEEQLRAAEERYRLLVEQTPAITYVDEEDEGHPDNWPTVYISPQVERIVGHTAEEWLADPDLWCRLVHPDDRERVDASNRHHYETGEPEDVEFRIVLRDGSVRWLRDQAIVVQTEEGQRRSQGILQDVTERKLAELALNDAERRYRTLIETVPAVTYIDTLGEDWSTMYVSPQVETMFGYAADAWIGDLSIWRSAIHPEDLDRVQAAVTRHNDLGEPLDIEYHFRHADGHWMWVRDQGIVVRDEAGEALFSQGLLHDVTEQKHAEERLREAEERYRGIVEHIPAAIYLDKADRSMVTVYVSPQIEAITGITPEEWLSDPEVWVQRMDPEDRDRVLGGYLAAAETGTSWSDEYRLQTRDGRTVWVHDETTYLHDEEGRPAFLQGVIFDITEQKLAEQALRESEQREREAAERLRALDEMKNTFLAAVSHELRSPLTSILELSLTLERAPDIQDEDRGDLLRRLSSNARKLDRLLKDLLDIDRLNRGIVAPQYRTTDVGALARGVVEHLDALVGRDVVVESDPVVIAADPPKIERIVENLLTNAVRHTERDRRIWLRVGPFQDGVVIAVEDDGPGVPAEIRDAVFEPFRQGPTASPHSPGTGIGLSLVARFAELHGGRAWVEERTGGGASFRVFIPGAPAIETMSPGLDGIDDELSQAFDAG